MLVKLVIPWSNGRTVTNAVLVELREDAQDKNLGWEQTEELTTISLADPMILVEIPALYGEQLHPIRRLEGWTCICLAGEKTVSIWFRSLQPWP